MRAKKTATGAVAAMFLVTGSVFADPGGHGPGNGNGHGAETSAAARDPETRGLEKALAVLETTPAAEQATESVAAALKRRLERQESELPDDSD